ncbi:MAG: hypothetical protein HQL68_11700 [Magnetococcales bacterium]|nr:hypothetical protein [Magnetococcales bacterium]
MLTVGIHSYNNALPYRLILEKEPGIKLKTGTPKEMAGLLKKKSVDIALVPSVTWHELPNLIWYPELGGIITGQVAETVKLFYKGKISAVRRVRKDMESKTSVALAEILFKQYWASKIEWVASNDEADGILQIGDKTISFCDKAFPEVLDLGERWWQWKQLPFVWAIWLGWTDLGGKLNHLFSSLNQYRQSSDAWLNNYLNRVISYKIGPEERESVHEFRRLLSGQA